jgi:hypothetical protein
MSTFLKVMRCRIWSRIASKPGQGLIESARILMPIAIFGLLALWLFGTVAGNLSTVARLI